LPQRHKDTKDIFIIISSCLGVLVAIKRESTNFITKKIRLKIILCNSINKKTGRVLPNPSLKSILYFMLTP
jgi:uncharacterized membrane protein